MVSLQSKAPILIVAALSVGAVVGAGWFVTSSSEVVIAPQTSAPQTVTTQAPYVVATSGSTVQVGEGVTMEPVAQAVRADSRREQNAFKTAQSSTSRPQVTYAAPVTKSIPATRSVASSRSVPSLEQASVISEVPADTFSAPAAAPHSELRPVHTFLLPGFALPMEGGKLAVEAITASQDGTEVALDVTFVPETEMEAAEQAAGTMADAQRANSGRSSVTGAKARTGFTYEEELFRTKWGWAAFNKAKEAAREIAREQQAAALLPQ